MYQFVTGEMKINMAITASMVIEKTRSLSVALAGRPKSEDRITKA